MAKSKLPPGGEPTGRKGRPTIYSEALGLKICGLVAEGHTLREITQMPDMPEMSTITFWAVDHAHFSPHYRRARAAAAHTHHDRIVGLTKKAESGEIDPSSAREAMRGLMWVAERGNPRDYGAKQELAHTSPDGSMSGGPVTVVINGVVPKPEA